jgi:hypothetical protein
MKRGFFMAAPTAALSRPAVAEAGELRALAARLERLTISRTAPEKFFEDRSQLVYELRLLASRVGRRHAG